MIIARDNQVTITFTVDAGHLHAAVGAAHRALAQSLGVHDEVTVSIKPIPAPGDDIDPGTMLTLPHPVPLLCDMFIGDGERCRKPLGHAGRCDLMRGL